MNDILPELKKGDVLAKADGKDHVRTFIVIKVGKGREFDEPVYYLQGMYGAKLKKAYTGEDLAGIGYRLKEDVSLGQASNAGGAS